MRENYQGLDERSTKVCFWSVTVNESAVQYTLRSLYMTTEDGRGGLLLDLQYEQFSVSTFEWKQMSRLLQQDKLLMSDREKGF